MKIHKGCIYLGILILLLIFYDVKGQGFTTYELNKYSGGLSKEQKNNLSLAVWSLENAHEDKKTFLQLDSKIQENITNNKSKKVKKIRNQQKNILLSQLSYTEEANYLYYQVYKEILSGLRRNAKPKDLTYDKVREEEKKGESLIKQANRNRIKAENASIDKAIDILEQAIKDENKGLKMLFLAIEGYYNIAQKIEFDIDKMHEQEFLPRSWDRDETIVITKDALIHYSDWPEINFLILEHFNVDSIEDPIFLTIQELENMAVKLEVIEEEPMTPMEIFTTEKTRPQQDSAYDFLLVENSIHEDTLTQVKITVEKPLLQNADLLEGTHISTVKPKEERPVSLLKPDPKKEEKPILLSEPALPKENKEHYYTIQILARKSPASKETMQKYFPHIQDIKEIFEDGWYKYHIGHFTEMQSAIDYCKQMALKNSFVAKYNNSKRVSIVYVPNH